MINSAQLYLEAMSQLDVFLTSSIFSFHCLLSWTSTSNSRVHLHTSPSLPEMAHTFLNLLSIEAMHNPERSVQWLTPELAWTPMWYNTCLHSKCQFLLLVINVFGTVSFYLFMSMTRMSFPLPSSQISLVYHSVLKYKVALSLTSYRKESPSL